MFHTRGLPWPGLKSISSCKWGQFILHTCNIYNGIYNYQFLLGSDAYPPTKTKGSESGYCEPFEELKKKFHCGEAPLEGSMGILHATNYTIIAATGANAVAAVE